MGVVSQLQSGKSSIVKGVVGRMKEQQQQVWEAGVQQGQAAQKAAGIPSLSAAISSPLGVTPAQRAAATPPPQPPSIGGKIKRGLVNATMELVKPGSVNTYSESLIDKKFGGAGSENADRARQLRNVPGLGSAVRALDTLILNPGTQKVTNIAKEVYTPGAGLGAINTLTRGAESAVFRASPRLGGSLAGRVAQTAATEAITGAPLGAAQYLSSQGDTGNASLSEAARQGVVGSLLGGVVGGTGPVIRSTIRRGLTAKPVPVPSYEGISLSGSRTPAVQEAPGLLNRIGSSVMGTIQQAGEKLTGGSASGLSPFRRADPYTSVSADTKSQLRIRFKKEPRAPLGVTAN